jgi:hypothetical protein
VLTTECGKGFSRSNLSDMRQFCLMHKEGAKLMTQPLLCLGGMIFQNQHIKVDDKVNNKVYNNLTINFI